MAVRPASPRLLGPFAPSGAGLLRSAAARPTRLLAPTLGGCLLALDLRGRFFVSALSARFLAPALAAALLAAPAPAQLVTGQVFEQGTWAPIASAMVHLLDADGTRVTSIPTDGAGRFALQVPEPGAWRVEAVRPGYLSVEPEAFAVEAGGVATLPPLELLADEEALENLPVPGRMIMGHVLAEGFDEPLPSVLVRALEHESIQPDRSYYHNQTKLIRGRAQSSERRELGMGYHLDRDMLAGMNLEETADAFRDIPGLRVTIDDRGNYVVSATMGRGCLHMHLDHMGFLPEQDFNDIRLDEIEAIEIYRSYREVPDDIRYSHLGFQIWGCGVAIIWTRVGW